MSKIRFSAQPIGAEWFDENVPCTQACPVLTNAGRYVAAIASGDDELAYRISRLPNPFPSICGRVCAAPCELACRRGAIDEPIAIRALKRYVTEQYGVESGRGSAMYREAAPRSAERDERIAIIGAGPAGMACAHDLATYGYRPVVFEAYDRAGGMMALGIPSYRLRRDLLNDEISAILEMGVELRTNQRLGRDFSLRSLRDDGFEAVFLGVGCMRGRDLRIPGVEKDGVLRAVDFLLNANLGYRVELGEDVVVIGGGNVALDAARTALREIAQGTPAGSGLSKDEIDEAGAAATATFDVARVAKRMGARRVRVVALENREEMPAHEVEIEEAEVEGIEIITRRGPHAIVGNGHVAGLETLDVSSVFDADGRFDPTFVEDSTRLIECDSVILAIGQAPDLSWLEDGDGVELSTRGLIGIEPETLATSAPGIYAGGDVAFGPRNLIDAIGDGRRAAASIHARITGIEPERPKLSGRKLLPIIEVKRPAVDYTAIPRVPVPAEATERRIGSPEIELGYTEEQARKEASRCLQCFMNIMLEPSLCILCGGCVDICPEHCIRIVPVGDIAGIPAPETPASALVIQEDRCIRCSLCVERCPTDALSLDGWSEASTAPIALEPLTS
jgi:NADPH-dependent glutamate synthase beta subunit-like oxidoreductase/NAD-dependent dihydropyrimidine dehydrogenase PreA subunit